jgi:Fe-S cluster biogenesis protein NfuA
MMGTTMKPEDILIRTLPTPNPAAIKFVINGPFKEQGKASFHSPLECEDLPLVRDLFSVDGVKQVHLFQNTLTVTQTGELDYHELEERVGAIIRSRYPVHNPKFGEIPTTKERLKSRDPGVEQIEGILDRTIRPGLQADGGDIEVMSFENNELKIVYQGACGGCPSSLMGTLDAIQGILRNELKNESLTVTPV